MRIRMQRRRRREQQISPSFVNELIQLLLALAGAIFLTRQVSSGAGMTRRQLLGIDQSDTSLFPTLREDDEEERKIPKQYSEVFAAISNQFSVSNGNNNQQHLRKQTTQSETGEKESRMAKYTSSYQYKPPEGQWQKAPECGEGPDYEDFFRMLKSARSRYNEDKQIYEHFFKHNKRATESGGNYIELGAFDGRTESNSRFFDLCLGWKGLLIEGNPITFEKMQAARPNAHRMSFAPSCSAEYEAVNKTVQFAKYPMANAGIQGKAKTYDEKPMVSVPCGPLGSVLEDVFGAGEHIHFFSLDVEGAEAMVLKTIDFDRVQIDVLMIEVKNNFCGQVCETRDEARAIMKQAGYRRYENLVMASDVYVRPGSGYELQNVTFAD